MDSVKEAKILSLNAQNLGIDLSESFDFAGKEIAELLYKKFPEKKYTFICGTAGNAGDAFATAKYLVDKNQDIDLYLVGRSSKIEHPAARKMWERLYSLEISRNNLNVIQDCYADDVKQADVLIEALVGTGLERENLNKRFHDVVKRVSHFTCPKIAIDVPSPHYTPDLTISINYAKTENAEVVEALLPPELETAAGPGELEFLEKPRRYSHKSKNGRLFAIHDINDAEILRQNIAIANSYETFIDIYNLNKQVNTKRIKGDFGVVKDTDAETFLSRADTILLGNFDKKSLITRSLINTILRKKNKKVVIFGNALDFLDPENLASRDSDTILVSNRKQLNSIKGFNGNSSLKRIATEKGLFIVVVGSSTTLYTPAGDFRIVPTPNAFSSHYENLIASSIATFSTINDTWLSIRAGVYFVTV